jgi:hypothetical protein
MARDFRAKRQVDPMKRRLLLRALGIAALAPLVPGVARATLVRGLTLKQLSLRATAIVALRALDSSSHYEDIAGRRLIVTDTRVRIEDVLAKGAPRDRELLVRTLGGRVGGMRELVLGQPALSLARSDVAFLQLGSDGAHWFTGMAQGHYPLVDTEQGELALGVSPQVPEIRDLEGSAVRALAGRKLGVARGLIQSAVQP